MRVRRLVLLGLLAVTAAATVVFWSWIDAQARAVVVLSGTSPTPVVSWAVRLATGEPRAERAAIGGASVTIVRPGRGHRWPAVVLFPGAARAGRDDPSVQRLANALARAGYLVVVPELPGAADGELGDATVRAAVDVAVETAHRDDVSGADVALAGAWGGGTVALLAAEDSLLGPRVSVVAAVSPWAAAANALRLATTGFVLSGGQLQPYDADPLLSLTAAKSLVAALPGGSDREQLRQLLQGVPPGDPDPLRVVRGLALANLTPPAAAVVRLLENTHAPSFDSLYGELSSSVRAAMERLSPLVTAPGLQARVEIAVAPHDRFAPADESRALQRASPRVHVTVTGSVSNGLPDPSLTQALATDGFVVRALRAAR